MLKHIFISLILAYSTLGFSQYNVSSNYSEALQKLSSMLNETSELNFKEAVFTVENTYFDNELDTNFLNIRIRKLTNLCKKIIKSRQIIYNEDDKEEMEKYASVFAVMTDTIPIMIDSNTLAHHLPFSYDFHDIWGYDDWSNMFVSKLLNTTTGNCHSLPYLYKILAIELGTNANISLAPNHFYIKHKNKKNGWYNTELTSGIFPIDAWIMASGYIHLDAIVNKLYMEALDDKQSIALCVIDLAQGYQRKIGDDVDYDFILSCCDTALKYYPHYINALILKAETKKNKFEDLMSYYGVNYASELLNIPEAKNLFEEMTKIYSKIHKLGYRKMPNEMYLEWLTSLKEERSKYENKEITR